MKSSNNPPFSPSSLTWQLTTFSELSGYQVYHIIQAREQVFVKDQHCTYIDADGLDIDAMHLSGDFPAYQDDKDNESKDSQNVNPQLVTYCRILTSTTPQRYPIIGRVLVLVDYRGFGLARELMIRAIEYCHLHFPNQPIHLSAQTYLTQFYESLGFVCEGVAYDAEGIEHVHMILAAH